MISHAIRTINLTRDFKTVPAVDDLTIEVRSGSVFGFLGPNGAGKTTTLRLLLGLLEPTKGQAEVLGYGYTHSSRTHSPEQWSLVRTHRALRTFECIRQPAVLRACLAHDA